MKLTKAQARAYELLPENGYKSANALDVKFSVLERLYAFGLAERISYDPLDWTSPSKKIGWRRAKS